MEVVLVHSYKGGSGKTIFSVNLANLLSTSLKQKVLLIEADFTGAAFQSIFKKNTPNIFFNDFLSKEDTSLEKYIYSENAFDVIYSNNKFQSSEGVHGGDQAWFLRKKRQLSAALSTLDYDVIIFDSAPGFSLFVVNILSLSDHVFLVSRTDKQSQDGLALVINNLYKKSINISERSLLSFSVILNQVPNVKDVRRVIDGIRFYLQQTFPFVENIYEIWYEHETSYYTTIEKFILPENNPTYHTIEQIVEHVFRVA